MIGNHGPAYDHRYPADRAAYAPICGTSDLRRCSKEQLVNSYDNAIRYSDHVLSRAIDLLADQSFTHDTALLYVSDHGESLGEHGLYLHGVPWRIAPAVQTTVPMVLWLSAGLNRRLNLDVPCLRNRALGGVSHDHVFHTVLGLLDVRTQDREPTLDLVTSCRVPALHGASDFVEPATFAVAG